MSKQITGKAGKSAFIWNVIGSAVNAAATMVLTILATRMAGIEEGGILGLAFGLCQIFSEIASYEVRPYQSTDLEQRFSFAEYYALRILTCTGMTILCAAYVYGVKYSGVKASVIFAICMFKMLDSFSDVFQGLFQQREHLEYAGQALTLRVTAASAGYIAVLAVTHNPVWAAWSMPVLSVVCVLAFDIPVALRFVDKVVPAFHWNACKGILIECMPLFASAFMNMYILNATKLQIDTVIPAMQGYWTPLYMPASVINLFSIFVFRPVLTHLREQWSTHQDQGFLKTVWVLLLWVAAVTLGALAGAYFLGIPVLGMLYGMSLNGYRTPLLIVLLGGGLNAAATVLYYIITVMRRQYYLLLGDGITFAATLLLTGAFVQAGGLTGAACAYVCSMLIRTGSFLLIAAGGYRRHCREEKK